MIITKNVVKIVGNGNCYVVEGRIMIDTGREEEREKVTTEIQKNIDLKDIEIVILTHLHYDHIGNLGLFPNAKVFASPSAVRADKQEKRNMVLKIEPADALPTLHNILKDKELTEMFKIIETPGHCKSNMCLYYEKDNVFFTGDTYFTPEISGRVDLPSSVPEEMNSSLKKVQEIIDKKKPIIASGHDY